VSHIIKKHCKIASINLSQKNNLNPRANSKFNFPLSLFPCPLLFSRKTRERERERKGNSFYLQIKPSHPQ
jgi:hypothetical protein